MKLKYDFAVRNVAGQTVAVAVGKNSREFNGMIKLGGSGEFIFNLLKNEISFEELVAAFLKEYDATEEQARTTIEKFITSVKEYGILE